MDPFPDLTVIPDDKAIPRILEEIALGKGNKSSEGRSNLVSLSCSLLLLHTCDSYSPFDALYGRRFRKQLTIVIS